MKPAEMSNTEILLKTTIPYLAGLMGCRAVLAKTTTDPNGNTRYWYVFHFGEVGEFTCSYVLVSIEGLGFRGFADMVISDISNARLVLTYKIMTSLYGERQ